MKLKEILEMTAYSEIRLIDQPYRVLFTGSPFYVLTDARYQHLLNRTVESVSVANNTLNYTLKEIQKPKK